MLSLSTFQENFLMPHISSGRKSFLLALSGGPDSMVLADLFTRCNIPFQAAHVNYHLRGKDSDDDQRIAEEFCRKNNVKFHLYSVREEEKPECSIQLWARDLRYAFFRKIMQEEGLDTLVTAHHLNDQAETFFINLLRGSGIRGLSGMPENENQILRPLLPFTKKEIYDYAEKEGIPFREDLSNKKNIYVRNRLRNEIIPKLEEINPHLLRNLAKSMKVLADTKDFAEAQVSRILEEISTENSDEIIINKEQLAGQLPFCRYEILRRFGFTEVGEADKIFSATTGSYFYSEHFKLLVNRNELILTPKKNDKENPIRQEILVAESAESIPDNCKISLTNIPELGLSQKFSWEFDAGKLIFPLKLRHYKEGDFFFPTGMTGRKTISKFFKDEKISVLGKQKTWLLCDGNDDILGILPFRQDRRAKAEPGSKAVTICSGG